MSLEINNKKGILHDVVFCYTKLRDPVFKYQSKTEKEFTVDCVVDKATAKEWKKTFKKQPVKEFDNDEFEEIFKIAPPFDNDEQYVIKLKAAAQYKDGKVKPAKYLPSVLVPNTDDNSDAQFVDVTDDVLVSNGSTGKVSFSITTNDFGTFAQLGDILVENLIEYEESGGSSFGSVAGGRSEVSVSTSGDEGNGDVQGSDESPENASEGPEDDFSDDIPF